MNIIVTLLVSLLFFVILKDQEEEIAGLKERVEKLEKNNE